MSASRLQYIYDVKRLLTKARVSDETRLNNNHLGFLLDERRAKEIRDTYKRNAVIEPVWLQDYGVFDLTPVQKAEDKGIAFSNCKYSKAEIPKVISLMDPISNTSDIGTYSIRSVSGEHQYNYMSADKTHLISQDSIMSKMRFFTKVGNMIYLAPEIRKARAILILDSPLDGYVLDNLDIPSGSLVVGTAYEVRDGSIVHNSITYQQGQSFTAATTTYTGSGKVQYVNQKRRMTNNDPYPMSHTMAEVVKMKIMTQDFGIDANVVADIKNDSIDDAIKR